MCPLVRPGVPKGPVWEGQGEFVKEDELRVRLREGRFSRGVFSEVRRDSLTLFSVSEPD